MYRIAFIEGDGIGPEISLATKKVLYALQDKMNLSIEILDVEAGDSSVRIYGKALPEHSINIIRDTDACLKAPIGESAADVIVYLRRSLDLYANVRPAKVYPNVDSLHSNVDLVIVRENTEDLYAGLEYELDGNASIAVKVVTRRASLRIADYAFKLAEFRDCKRHVTAVHKANLLRKTDGLFASCCREVSKRYPNVHFAEMYVDACAMNLVRNPEWFDVIVTSNMYGDILSDEAAQVTGSIGLAPSANIGDNYAIFEPVHGSAPDIAGKGIANPLSFILSAGMMFNWLGMKHNDKRCLEASSIIERCVSNVLIKGIKTMDIGGSSSTQEVADAIVRELQLQL
jgi:3-isopropylmalate dehydrogenase